MALTTRQRERAVEMFSDPELSSSDIARKLRIPQATSSVAALRANWTRGNNVLGSSSSKSAPSRARTSTRRSSASASSEPMVVKIHNKKLTTAVRQGRPVSLVLEL